MTSLRSFAPLVAALFAALAFAPAGAAPPLAGPCAMPDFVPGAEEVRANPGETVVARFTMDAAAAVTLYAAVAFRFSTASEDPIALGASAERAVVTAFYERADGTLLGTPNAFIFPYGAAAQVPDAAARVQVLDAGGCGAFAVGPRTTLEAGDYRVVVLGATELGSAVSALLPPEARVTEVTRAAAHVLTESAFDCEVNVRASVNGYSTTTLIGCATTYTAATSAYRLVFADRGPDPDHIVAWSGPDGTFSPRKRFEIGRGSPGEWTLQIPRYVTTLGSSSGFAFPLPGPPMSSDAGVYGMFADVA